MADLTLDEPPCPLCGATERSSRYARHFAPYALARCSACGFEYLCPRPPRSDLHALYTSDLYFESAHGPRPVAAAPRAHSAPEGREAHSAPEGREAHSAPEGRESHSAPEGCDGHFRFVDDPHTTAVSLSQSPAGYGSYTGQHDALRATYGSLLARLRSLGAKGGRLLDVGCGYGYLLREAATHYTVRHGTELSRDAAHQARQHADEVFVGGAEDAPADFYDLVTATHVLEHSPDPREFTSALVTRAKPGGLVLVAVPDAGSWWRRALGHRWPSFKLPEHVLYFNERSLRRLLLEVGLDRVERVPYPHAFPFRLAAEKLLAWIPPVAGGIRRRLHRVAEGLPERSVWIPGTTLAMIGRRRPG